MATATRMEYLVIVPDKPDMRAKRLEVRPKHFEGLEALKATGNWKMGGALFNSTPEGADPSQWDWMGSTLVAEADSKQEIIDILSKDIYATSGVWDMEKIQIHPFKCAFRNP
ncbi:YCII-related domain-containing protein [Sarocladium implicatum]|nr:YCII-related domain-containing protein [Sarocladium implicatum]